MKMMSKWSMMHHSKLMMHHRMRISKHHLLILHKWSHKWMSHMWVPNLGVSHMWWTHWWWPHWWWTHWWRPHRRKSHWRWTHLWWRRILWLVTWINSLGLVLFINLNKYFIYFTSFTFLTIFILKCTASACPSSRWFNKNFNLLIV